MRHVRPSAAATGCRLARQHWTATFHPIRGCCCRRSADEKSEAAGRWDTGDNNGSPATVGKPSPLPPRKSEGSLAVLLRVIMHIGLPRVGLSCRARPRIFSRRGVEPGHASHATNVPGPASASPITNCIRPRWPIRRCRRVRLRRGCRVHRRMGWDGPSLSSDGGG
jgi:hypothetical protein